MASLIKVAKHWANQRGLCDAHKGMLNSFGCSLLVINYLQQPRSRIAATTAGVEPSQNSSNSSSSSRSSPKPVTQGLLPVLAWSSAEDFDKTIADAWTSSTPQPKSKSKTNTHLSVNLRSLPELLSDFFQYYSQIFDAHQDAVSVRHVTLRRHEAEVTGEIQPKQKDAEIVQAMKASTGLQAQPPDVNPCSQSLPQKSVLYIQDPFDASDNVARSLTWKAWRT